MRASRPRRLLPLALTLLTSGSLLAATRLLPSTAWSFSALGFQGALLTPRGLSAIALLPWIVWASGWSLAGLSRTRRVSALLLRSLGVAGSALALAQPVQELATERSSTVFVVDVSDSIDDAALADAQRYIASASAQQNELAHLALVSFAAEARQQALPTRKNSDKEWTIARHKEGRASQIERALSLALGLLAPEARPQIVLFSDGRETDGDLLRAADALARRGVSLWSLRAEVGIADLTLPRTIRVGEPFAVEARLAASVPQQVRVRLFQSERPQEIEAERQLEVHAGENALSFRSLVRRAGSARYTLEITPLGGDQFAENNRFERSTIARGAPHVLVVEREPARASPFLDLLRAAAFEVELRTPEHAPRRASELLGVDFYVLSDVPASALARGSLEAIAQYVDEGGGFMMAGGERSFGLGGYQGSRLEALLPVGLEGSLQRDEPSLALMLAIDKSGSMAGDKLERAKEAALATAELLPPDSYLGVIGFDAEPVRIARLSVASRGATLARSVGALAAGGGTALFPALDAAYADLAGVRARLKHVVVLTDGQTQEESLDALAENMSADGITVSTVGLGEDVNRGLLMELAARAGGRSYFTRDPARVPRLFAQEAELLTRSSAIEDRVRVHAIAPADFLHGLAVEEAPPLRGYVATRARSAPAQLILESERGEPILARMRVGLGWSIALTTDVKPRWSADWFRWRSLSRLYAQLVREHMRHDERATLPIETRLDGDTLVAAIEVLDERARFVNGLTGTLMLQNDRGFTRSEALAATGPGRYEARIPLPALGSYSLSAQLGELRASGSASLPFPAEYRPPFGAAEALLRAASARTPADVQAGTQRGDLPAPTQLLAGSREGAWRNDAGSVRGFGPSGRARRERWQVVLWCVLGLFLLDLAARRAPSLAKTRRQGA